MKEWFQTKDLLGLPGMPNSIPGINYRAKNESWKRRKAEGVKGRAYEYHISSFPDHIQNTLNQTHTNKGGAKQSDMDAKFIDPQEITSRLVELKGERSLEQLAKDWHMSIEVVDSYINQGVIPPIDAAHKISILDGCDYSWLVCDDNSTYSGLSINQKVLSDSIRAVEMIISNERVEMDLEYKSYCISMIYELSMKPDMAQEIVLTELIHRLASGGTDKDKRAV
ncbi:hypothetical protein ABKY54_004158 [Vibrio harveyi]